MEQATLGEKYNPWKSGRYAPIPEWLHRRKEVSHGAKSVMARLLRYAGKNGTCYPKQETLAEDVGMELRQLQRYVKELIRHKLISTEHGSTKFGHRSLQYFFHRHEWQKSDATQKVEVTRHFLQSHTSDMSRQFEQKTVDKPIEMKLIKNRESHLRESGRESIKNRYNGNNNVFSDYFFKEMGEAKDKVAKCLEIVKRNSGELEKKLNTFYDVLSWLRGAGAEKEVEQSWRWHWKIVNRMPREYIWDNVIQSNLRERLLSGTIRNIGAAYNTAVTKLAIEKKISLEPKRGMAKAEPAKQQIRKVA